MKFHGHLSILIFKFKVLLPGSLQIEICDIFLAKSQSDLSDTNHSARAVT